MIELYFHLVHAALIACVIMTVLWMIQLRTGNAGIVDVGWSGTIPLLAIFYALSFDSISLPRTRLALVMAVLWGGRLAWHIHQRSRGKPEDARYTELRRAWGRAFQFKLFIFFQFQAAAAVLFSLPFLLAIRNVSPPLSLFEYAGFTIWTCAWLGEGSADRQLAQFKSDPTSKGNVCETGWWNYSRHPNYFFEWLIWVSLAVFCWPSSLGELAVICPVLMLFFLFKLTGIPATEEQAIKSKGDKYLHYQKTTSPFVPWFKKKI